MWMCQSVIAKCEDIIERMDNCVRALALAATFSLRTKLCESLRMQAMNKIGDRLISHKDFRHIPSEVQNAIFKDLAVRGGDFERGWDLLFHLQEGANLDRHNFSRVQHRHTDSIHIRGSKTRTCRACREMKMIEVLEKCKSLF